MPLTKINGTQIADNSITANDIVYSLDDAYDNGGAGTGRTIVADAGAVIIDGTASSLALEVTGNIRATGTVSSLGNLQALQSIGDEGGEIFLSKAVTNTTLTTGVTIDVYQNKLRFFETGGTNRGGYFDVSSLGAGVATNLASGGGGTNDHSSLLNLTWTGSGHTGTANRVAAFDATGSASYMQIGASGGVQAWDADLDGYAALSTTGLVARSGAGTAATRTITAGSGQLTVTNGDGVGGNPTIDLAYASKLRESGGPTTLTVGAIAEGQIPIRRGSTLVGTYLAVALTVSSANGDAFSEPVSVPAQSPVVVAAGAPV